MICLFFLRLDSFLSLVVSSSVEKHKKLSSVIHAIKELLARKHILKYARRNLCLIQTFLNGHTRRKALMQ